MDKISADDFLKILLDENGDDLISGYIVEIEKPLNINLENVYLKTIFSNIKFIGKSLRFSKYTQEQIHILEFVNCEFICNLNFDNCNVNEISFHSNVFNCDNFEMRNCKINHFNFKGANIFKNGNLDISNCVFDSLFDIEKIDFHGYSRLQIKEVTFNNSVSIINSEINQLIFSHCFFKNNFDYFRNKSNNPNNSIFFNRCEFNYSSFSKTSFNNDTHFADCKFLDITKFEDNGDEVKTVLRFDNCEFLKQVSFNKSRIHKISFNNLKFHDIISLQEAYFDIVDIDRTIFEKQAYFDEIQIKQIYRCSTRTIRTIKLQLQKAENKIDYNRFRVYEFNAYREDIKNKLKEFKSDKDHLSHRVREPIQLKRDAFILWISDIVSEYGTDWKRALKFTICLGFIFYSLFFICEKYEYKILFSWESFSLFISGLFRFFLVTDFFNPLDNDRTYLTNPLSWLIFILGKIFIAFGIYEMIQSFRKFKA